MKTSARLARWGNSLAVRIPRSVAEVARLREGDAVAMSVAKDGAVTIRPTRKRLTLDQLMEGFDRKTRHGETDWGAPQGKETW